MFRFQHYCACDFWLSGDFGNGAIDLGGLEVYNALYFKKIWETHSGGPKGFGVSFYEPTSIPFGFNLIGHYCKPNSVAMFAVVLIAKDTTGDPSQGALKSPIDYTLIWTSKGLNVSQREDGYIWLPVPPDGYKAIGHIVTTSPEKPSLDKVRCVRSDFTDLTKVDKWIWGHKTRWGLSIVHLHTTKPKTRALSVPTGMFLARNGSNTHELACLKMVKTDPYSAMPNSLQIRTMINAYAPWVYFHPHEQYFPSSVLWFFENGAELHQHGQPPKLVINDGDNLPNNGTADDAFLDLPQDQPSKERLKKGFLPNAIAYIHVKPALGGICTDLAIWLYYPFNGGGKFQLGPFTIDLGKIGEHVSDWEHITLRVDNFHGTLTAVYLSQHAKGKWLTPSEFELMNGTRPVVYASLHGHAHYSTPTSHVHVAGILDSSDIQMLYDELQIMSDSRKSSMFKEESFFGFGARDDVAKSDNVMDIASTYNVICVDYMESGIEPWLDYTGRWGPKITYEFTEEMTIIADSFPHIVRKLVIKLLRKLPPELLGEEGPQGPKMKESWTGDERV
ncbi:putative vacuolar protein sorting-associated protein [Helianthus annuus]|nr:putative vacuolar protein sorting-associated protein [Helianthus annuus]